MRRGLFVSLRRFFERKYLRNNRANFFLLDELRDFVQFCRVWRNRDRCSANAMLVEFGLIDPATQARSRCRPFLPRHRNEQAYLCQRDRARHQHPSPRPRILFRIINRNVSAELLQQILIRRRRRRENFRTACFRNLYRETTDSARAAMNENSLTRLEFRSVDQRLPCGQRRQRHGGRLNKRERFRFDRRFILICQLRIPPSRHQTGHTRKRRRRLSIS